MTSPHLGSPSSRIVRFIKERRHHRPYDAEVKWLESTGTQYIDTGIRCDAVCGFSITCEAIVATFDESYPVIAGAQFSDWSNWLTIYEDYGIVYNGDSVENISRRTNQKITTFLNYMGDGKITVESPPPYTTKAYSPAGIAANICIFAAGTEVGVACLSKSRVYSMVVSNGQNIVRDFIPVRFTNELGESEGAMYDKVSKQLFRNQGTGKLIVGADADMPYDAEVEYLESTRTQYIDTGIDHVSDSGFSVTGCFLISTHATYPALAGVSFEDESNWLEVYEDGGVSFVGTMYSGVYILNAKNVVTAYANYLNDGLVYYDNDPPDNIVDNPVINARYMLFCAGSENGPMGFSNARIYGFKATIGQEIVRDLIPVRFTNELGESEGAMYDKVSKQLFRNQGTGKFIVGTDVDMPYDYVVEYIETDGVASYIDTGIVTDVSSEVKVCFKVISVPYQSSGNAYAQNAICGARENTSPSGGARFNLGVNTLQLKFGFLRPALTNQEIAPQYDNDIHVVEMKDSLIKFDGQEFLSEHLDETEGFTHDFCLGKSGVIDPNNASRYYSQTRFYSCSISSGGKRVFDGIPVVDSNGVACMYDYISKTLKYNAAETGTITAGPQI